MEEEAYSQFNGGMRAAMVLVLGCKVGDIDGLE
jgi:hypothetical protein